MILDEDVRQFFRNKLGKPSAYGGHGTLQIFKGIDGRHWKDAHPGGCARHFSVFNNFGVIPEYCFDCYKVTITPRNVVELFKLLMVFEKLVLAGDNTRKCMTEGRDDCPDPYKGFIYSRSIEEGEEILHMMQDMIAHEIAPEVAVVLKRGCSEYGAAYPAYSQVKSGAVFMEYDKEWKVHEDFVDRNSIFDTKVPAAQAVDNTTYSPAEIFAMHYWLRYAAAIGDISYIKITGCTLPPLPDLKRPPFAGA